MFKFLLIVQALVAISLITVILMQRSEGGGLGVGGSSSGFMTARSAADFLTRATSILGGTFIVLSILMAAIAGVTRQAPKIDTSLVNSVAPLTQPNQPNQPTTAPAPNSAPNSAPTGNSADNGAVPLAQ